MIVNGLGIGLRVVGGDVGGRKEGSMELLVVGGDVGGRKEGSAVIWLSTRGNHRHTTRAPFIFCLMNFQTKSFLMVQLIAGSVCEFLDPRILGCLMRKISCVTVCLCICVMA